MTATVPFIQDERADMPRKATTKPQARIAKAKAAKPAGEQSPGKKPAKAPNSEAQAPSGKLGTLISLMRRPDGATLADLVTATDWQAHSVRGAISGALKKRLGLTIVSARTGDVRTYRIAG